MSAHIYEFYDLVPGACFSAESDDVVELSICYEKLKTEIHILGDAAVRFQDNK